MRLNRESINFPPTNFSFHHQIVPGRSYSPSLEKPHNKPWTRRSYRRRVLGRYLGISHRRGNYRLLPSGSSFPSRWISSKMTRQTFAILFSRSSLLCFGSRFHVSLLASYYFPDRYRFIDGFERERKYFFFVVISAKDPAGVQKHRPLLIVPKIIF